MEEQQRTGEGKNTYTPFRLLPSDCFAMSAMAPSPSPTASPRVKRQTVSLNFNLESYFYQEQKQPIDFKGC